MQRRRLYGHLAEPILNPRRSIGIGGKRIRPATTKLGLCAPLVLCLSVLSLFGWAVAWSAVAATESDSPEVIIHVNTRSITRTVPATVYGQGLLNRVGSDEFIRTPEFLDSVIDSSVGALRWPGAGHNNIPRFHFDNAHSVYFREGPFGTKRGGNIWDPLYPPADAASAKELVTLSGLVSVLRATHTVPLLVFTWRSPQLWRDIGGRKVFYRDPAPRRLDGSAMPGAEAALLSARDLQLLENRLMLKKIFRRRRAKQSRAADRGGIVGRLECWSRAVARTGSEPEASR
jgi:hypothetical protein